MSHILSPQQFIFYSLMLIAGCQSLSARSYDRHAPFVLIIDPAGNAVHTGRKLDDDFERGVTLQLAQDIKSLIELTNPRIRVVLTRTPGHIPQPLEYAHIANRVGAHAFLSLHCYQEADHQQHMTIYRFGRNDDFITPPTQLAFYRYDQAHIFNKTISATWADAIKEYCSKEKIEFQCHGPYALPFKPLLGVTSPAIALEMSIKDKLGWRQFCKPLVEAITAWIKQYEY